MPSADVQDLSLPHSLELERAILGSILVEGSRLSALTVLTCDHFYRQVHRTIFGAMLALEQDGIPVDLPILADRLGKTVLEDVGGKAYLSSLTDVTGVRGANVEYYTSELIKFAQARAAILTVQRLDVELRRNPDAILNGALPRCVDDLSRISTELDRRDALAFEEAAAWPDPPDRAAFHGIAGELVQCIQPHTEADPVALLANLLVCFGNDVGRSPYFPIGVTRHRTNLFVALVGQSAFGRKGESERPIRYLFEQIDPHWAQNCVGGGLSTGEGLLQALRDRPEADKRRLFTEGEFSSVLRHLKREGNTLSQKIREMWDAPESFRNDTKTDPIVVTGAHVSVVGHITLEELRAELTDVDRCNGFANRFMWLAVKRHGCLPDPQPLDDAVLQPYIATLRARLNDARRRGRVLRDARATAVYSDIYRAFDHDWEESNGGVVSFLSRAMPIMVRLSTVYALLDGASEIREEHIAAARALWDYSERSVRFLFGGLTGNAFADRLLRSIRQMGAVPKSRLYSLSGNNVDRPKIDRALELLVKLRLAHVERRQTGGRPLELWRPGPGPVSRAA